MKTAFTYKNTDACAIQGDFYPATEKQAPLIVYMHGGGLIWGNRKDIVDEQIALYNQAGFNVCSIDYRLAPETKLQHITEDIQDVLVWLKENGKEEYDFDAERIAMMGSSAGGYLALLSGTFPVKPKVIVSFYGYGNILADWYTKPSPHFNSMKKVPEKLARQLIQHKELSEAPIERRYAIYLYCRQQGKWIDYVSGLSALTETETLRPYCPVKNIESSYPATLLLHGNKDKDVPHQESVNMNEALEKFGIQHQLITIPNGEHSFDQDMENSVVTDAFNQVIAFLKTNL